MSDITLLFRITYRQYLYYLPTNVLLKRATINVKRAEPIIAHKMGKGFPSIFTTNNSGKATSPAIHRPMYAPMKPTTIETRQPPTLYPAMAWPIPPQIAAINKSRRNPKTDILIDFDLKTNNVYKKHNPYQMRFTLSKRKNKLGYIYSSFSWQKLIALC